MATRHFRQPAPRAGLIALLAALVSFGCGSSDDDEPEPPAQVTLSAPSTPLSEAMAAASEFTLSLAPTVSTETRVTLSLSGTATRDEDYELGDLSVTVPGGQARAAIAVRPFRDFDEEGDETIVLAIDSVQGNAEAGMASEAEVMLVDGPTDAGFKTSLGEQSGNLSVVNVPTGITAEGFALQVLFVNSAARPTPRLDFVVELSRSLAFEDVQVAAAGEVRPLVVGDFPEFRSLPIDTSSLGPGDYYLRVRVELPEGDETVVEVGPTRHGFSVDGSGLVVVTCTAPDRPSPADSADPLAPGAWHLRNTGQSGFAENPGIAGNDLGMTEVLANGLTGRGVNVVVHDTGTQICHPDLAANMADSESWNFNAGIYFGAEPTDPYFPWNLGDHGTSVAGVIGAVAENGMGSRGVASEVRLRTYSFPSSVAADTDDLRARSLGASAESPNSSTGHVFNMSYGSDDTNSNASDDFVNLMRFGTGQLRGGNGAVYVKSAGNSFESCSRVHPLSDVVGCQPSNDDAAHNLPYLLVVGAFGADGLRSSYSSAGSNLWVSAPAGSGTPETPSIITTDQAGANVGYTAAFSEADRVDHQGLNPFGDYTTLFSGTSAAAPVTAGAVAVLLEAAPELTWRDVKHVFANTSVRLEPDLAAFEVQLGGSAYTARLPWSTNAAGYGFHNSYGFGAIALDDAVRFARAHAPNSLGPFVESEWFEREVAGGVGMAIPDRSGAGVTDSIEIADLPADASIEAVVVSIQVDHASPMDLAIHLTSPGGTESIVNSAVNTRLRFSRGIDLWNLLSNAFYGESPNGDWTLRVVDVLDGDTGTLSNWRLKVYYGTHPPRPQ